MNEKAMAILQGVLFVLWFMLAAMWLRLGLTSEYRRDLIATVAACTRIDGEAGRPWRWRWAAYDTVSFDDMMWQPWKPLRWFYEDKSFLSCPRS